MGHLGEYVFEDSRWTAPGTWADISLARKVLGWEPRVSLAAGMKKVLEAEG